MPNTTNNVALRSEEVQEILTAIPVWMIRWGNTVIFLLIVLLMGISYFVKYPDIISSEAVITTPLPPQKEFAKVAAKIDTLLVEDHQLVRARTPLAILENTANYRDVFLLQSIIDTIQLKKNSFYFPAEQLPLLFLGDIESDFALFENSYDQYLLNQQLQPFDNEALAKRNALVELHNRLQNLEVQQELNAAELAFKKTELARQKSLFEEGVISAQEYENKQLENLQAERNFKNNSLAISQIKETIVNTKSASRSTEISRRKEEKVLLRNVIQSFNQLKKAVKAWELNYVLKAEIDGRVSFLDYWTEKQSVSSGQLVFTILPANNQSFVAHLKSPALNAGKIKAGQEVNIKLENYPDTEFGLLKGQVKSIALITDSEGLYRIEVALPQRLITTYKKEIEFRQEMKGVAEIITEDLRLIERFFYQFKSLLE